jgi:hypothetical protein
VSCDVWNAHLSSRFKNIRNVVTFGIYLPFCLDSVVFVGNVFKMFFLSLGSGRHPHSNGLNSSAGQSLSTPLTTWNNLPLERKSKFASLTRLFKPWKWRVKRKSDKLESVSQCNAQLCRYIPLDGNLAILPSPPFISPFCDTRRTIIHSCVMEYETTFLISMFPFFGLASMRRLVFVVARFIRLSRTVFLCSSHCCSLGEEDVRPCPKRGAYPEGDPSARYAH